jgi:hypothetical protein
MIGELGSYSNNPRQWNRINEAIHRYTKEDSHTIVVDTQDLMCKEDKIHFNSEGQRLMGERMGEQFLAIMRKHNLK